MTALITGLRWSRSHQNHTMPRARELSRERLSDPTRRSTWTLGLEYEPVVHATLLEFRWADVSSTDACRAVSPARFAG